MDQYQLQLAQVVELSGKPMLDPQSNQDYRYKLDYDFLQYTEHCGRRFQDMGLYTSFADKPSGLDIQY